MKQLKRNKNTAKIVVKMTEELKKRVEEKSINNCQKLSEYIRALIIEDLKK